MERPLTTTGDVRRKLAGEKLRGRLDALETARMEGIMNPQTISSGFMMNGVGSPAWEAYREKMNREGEIAKLRDALSGGPGELDYREGRNRVIEDERPLGRSMLALGDATIGTAEGGPQAPAPKPVAQPTSGGGGWGARPPEGVAVSDDAAAYYIRQAQMRQAQAMADDAEARAEAVRLETDPIEKRRRMLEQEGDIRRRAGMTGGMDMEINKDAQGRTTVRNLSQVPSMLGIETELGRHKAEEARVEKELDWQQAQVQADEEWNSPRGQAERQFTIQRLTAPVTAAASGRTSVAIINAQARLAEAYAKAQGGIQSANIRSLADELEALSLMPPGPQRDQLFAVYQQKEQAALGALAGGPAAGRGTGAGPTGPANDPLNIRQ